MKFATKISFCFLLCLFFLFSCKDKKQPENTLTSGIIEIACAENFQNIIASEVEVFSVHNPEAFVFPRYTSEDNAIKMLIDDSVRLAIVSRDLNAAEKAKFPKNRIIRKYIFAFEGIAIIANKSNRDTLFSISELTKILKGETVTWKQLNPDSPLDTIRVFFNNNESSVLRYVVDSLTSGTKKISKYLYATNNTEELFEKIAKTPNAIAVVGLNQLGNETSKNYEQAAQKVRFVWISKEEKATGQNSFLPYAGDLNKEQYPLWRPIYVLLAETREGLPKGFCFFLTQEVGQKVVLKAGLMPITDAQNTWTQWGEK
ncbi:MAG: substrate-binding domain-containing protein [Prevotellaceae bacterium]|nr:substrate-binding domain-containing protein [Prevotellaceae bacterium]